ncbi:MAG: type II toxin-antitoxin system VapC family toxin [Kiritimatiellae bacterium]|nr:type II toxin-antitoxin system VapC family toxin [Kiritimatiellia bacterium]
MNYLVDTCVLSELAKRHPNEKVVNWLAKHAIGNLFFVSVVTLGEIMEGIESLPPDHVNKSKLEAWFRESILDVYGDNIVPFDKDAAIKWGEIKGRTNRAGKVRPDLDLQIAATAIVRNMTVVTRNTADMAYTGVKSINPFGG